jgi:hypothetical protein
MVSCLFHGRRSSDENLLGGVHRAFAQCLPADMKTLKNLGLYEFLPFGGEKLPPAGFAGWQRLASLHV